MFLVRAHTCSYSGGQLRPSSNDLISCLRAASQSLPLLLLLLLLLLLRLCCVLDASEHMELMAKGALMPRKELAGATSFT